MGIVRLSDRPRATRPRRGGARTRNRVPWFRSPLCAHGKHCSPLRDPLVSTRRLVLSFPKQRFRDHHKAVPLCLGLSFHDEKKRKVTSRDGAGVRMNM